MASVPWEQHKKCLSCRYAPPIFPHYVPHYKNQALLVAFHQSEMKKKEVLAKRSPIHRIQAKIKRNIKSFN